MTTQPKQYPPPAIEHFDSLPNSALVDKPVVQALYGVRSNTTFWRRVQEKAIPQPVKVGPSNRWSVGVLREHLTQSTVAA